MHINLSDTNSIANRYLFEMRDTSLQTDRQRFRNNMKRLGSIMAYEISKKIGYRKDIAHTPLGQAEIQVPGEHPVLVSILRAGIPFYSGFQEVFDQSDAGFIGAYRQEDGRDLTIKLEYSATPQVAGKTVIVIDPMLATGKSAIDAVNALCRNGLPSHLHLACMVAAPEGLKYVTERLSVPNTIWSFAVDEKLDERSYIVPGLGDAGDLSFGNRI